MNWTKADDLPLVRRLIEEGFADYCEVLIDNFLHVEPDALRRAFGDVPLAFHIMHSRFIERPADELAFIAQRIRGFIRALSPMYVSDHLLRFTVGGRSVALLPELDYERQGELALDKVRRFQGMLEHVVCFENYPSIVGSGRAQPEFFRRLVAETGAGLLFDLSNAIIAQRNCGVPTSAWASLVCAADHFHTAGHDFFDGCPAIALDLHGTAVAEDTLELMAAARAARGGRPLTVTLERDHNVAYEAWRDDIHDIHDGVSLMYTRFISSVSVSLLAALALLVGCGDDEGSGGSTGTTSTSSSSSGSSSSSTGGDGGGGDGGGGGGGGDGGSDGGGGAGEGGSGGTGGGDESSIALRFEGRVGADVFSCAETYALGTASSEVGISDFRLYIHDIRLHRADGDDVPVTLDQDGLWQHQDLVLLDFEDKTGSCANGTEPTNGEVHGTVPQGTYDGLSFKLGVPFALNHGDVAAAPSPLNLSGLFWSWEAGYKFARIDTVPAEGSARFFLHLGSTGCVADTNGAVTECDRSNIAEVVLTGFDPLTATVLVDFAAVVAASDLSTDGGGAPGCMSGPDDPECDAIFERLGIDIADGTLHPEAQELFRVE